ncbi:hypothetical protein BDY19DRAFT_1016980 [Irpex rosettiformis]|uniref:Uncharacterized protein n=1 Tax=Irpex rosettiformis TaxID=378272 RepID=A0ACB8TWZ8_9APHY|nr:hypothetical protein BDY19DRAFT_1016980 [Irpex rosettiformis]
MMASTSFPIQYPEPSYHSFVDFPHYDIDGIGFIVPQQLYIHRCLRASSEKEWKQNPPPSIDFKVNGRLGISLIDAENFARPNRRKTQLRLSPAPREYSASVPVEQARGYTIHIQWPGYKPVRVNTCGTSYNVEFMDDLERLSARIAHVVHNFLESPTSRIVGQWNGWDDLQKFRNNPDKVYLLRLVSVSAFTWQPVLAVADEVFMPQPQHK